MFSKQGFLRTRTRPWRRSLVKRSSDGIFWAVAKVRRHLATGRIVAVTGSSGKTTTTRLISGALSKKYRVSGSDIYNTFPDIIRRLALLRPHAEIAVFEAGATVPGSIRSIAALIRPDVAVVTMVAREHHSAFRTLEAIAAEKSNLVAALPADGLAILNGDDPRVAAMAGRTGSRTVLFGASGACDYRIAELSFTFPSPLVVVVECRHGRFPIRSSLAGRHFAHDIAAAFAVAVELGVPPSEAAERIGEVPTVHNRCEIVEIPGGPMFILDIKGSYHSMPIALDLLAEARVPRKRAVIGHLSDFNFSSRKAYSSVYALAAAVADEVIFVGENAHRSGASRDDREAGRFKAFDDVLAAREYIRATAIPGEAILVKGAGAFHLERIGMSFREEVQCWEYRCGYTIGCADCGLYNFPLQEHSRVRRARKRAGIPLKMD